MMLLWISSLSHFGKVCLVSFNSIKRIEAPAPSSSSTGGEFNKPPSRYDNAPSLFDLVQINLLKTTSTAAASASASSSTSYSGSSTIPQKRPQLQITQQEATVETDTQHPKTPSNFTHTQTSLGTQEPRSNQISNTRAEYINVITVDSGTSNVAEPSHSDSQESAPSNATDISVPSQSSNTNNSNDILNISMGQISHDDNDSDMSIDQDNEEMKAAEENAIYGPDTNEPSVVVNEPDYQGSTAAIPTTITTAQRLSLGTSFNRTTSYHSLELYEDIDDEGEESEEFVDTSEILIDVEAEDEEQDGISQSSEEFYDVKEAFSATVSMATTPTIIEEANTQTQDETTPVIVNVIEATAEDLRTNVQEKTEGEIMDRQDVGEDELELEEEADQPIEEGQDAQVEDTEKLGAIEQANKDLQMHDDVEAQENKQRLYETREPDRISQESQSLGVESTRGLDTNEPAQSATGQDVSFNVLEDEETLLSVEQDGPVSDMDAPVVSPSIQDEELTQSEQTQSIVDPLIQDVQLPSFGLEGKQQIEEVHLLMDRQDEQMALHEPIEEEMASTTMPELQPEASIQDQHGDLLSPATAVDSTHVDGSDHDQQVQMDDGDDGTGESDQQVIDDDNSNTTGSLLLQSDQVHSFLLEEIQSILQEESEEAEEQQEEFTIENEPTPPLPIRNSEDAVVSHIQTAILPGNINDDGEDNDVSTIVAGNDNVDVEMQDVIVVAKSDSDKANPSESPSQAPSVMDGSVQEIASIRDSLALDLIQSQNPFIEQSEEVKACELEKPDDLVEDTSINFTTGSEKEPVEDNVDLHNVEFNDTSPMDDDYDDEEEDALMADVTLEEEKEEENEQRNVQTQKPVAVALDDVPLSCLNADTSAMGDRTVCNMDLPPYAIVPMWWYDAHDSNQKGIVYLFGKVFDDQQDKYVSCCVRIKNIVRELYILPRQFQIDDEGNPTHIRVDLNDVQQEIKTLLEHKKVSTYTMTTCEKQYVFSGTDIPRSATYIKLHADPSSPFLISTDYEFPTTQSGRTFSHIFGANTHPLEHFLIQRGIMGPCWLNLVQCTKLDNDLSWCALNISLGDPKCCSVLQRERDAPPLNVMSLSLQLKMSRLGARSNQVVAASLFFCKDVNVDTLDYTAGLNGYRSTMICLAPNMSYPADAYENTEKATHHTISLENTEFALLSRLVAAIHVFDPDIISGHNFFGGDLDTLLTRMKKLRVPHWHKLGRLKSNMLPKTSGNAEGSISSSYYQRLHMRGRIVCDTFDASQDLIKSKSFHLSELAKAQLGIVRKDIQPQQLDFYYKTGHQLLALAKHCSLDAYITFALMAKLQILPLTKQLTRLSGNLWSRSIHGARSERNEYLLLHTFYKKGYLCPDKPMLHKKHSFQFVDEALELELPASKRRLGANGKEMPSFEGGLVLEPKTGIYDRYVLLLDFNSLYPSIMQEFNVCFTTMDVNANVIDTEAPHISQQATIMGILPELVKMFVDRRKRVKQLMNDPSLSTTAKAQYQIEQMGLKLTANSMYGCLGSSYSRFFARPLAAFITAKGRDILRDTVQIAEQSNSGVDVIYGDTDSIMVNTNQTVLSRANRIGQQLKDQVNAKYTTLEIDIDGVFRRTLLLKKKKYAAQVVTKQANGSYMEALEVKGLDIVRRDGCDLSRDTSEHVLQLILSNQPQETIANSIHEYIERVANRVRASEVPVHEYIIRKQLTKSPEEYRSTKGNPHVIVAKDMRRSGIAVKSGDTIPYIYCTKTTGDGVVVREPHKDWYLLKQVVPSVDRICMPLEGTDRAKLIACLHLNTPQPPAPRPQRRRPSPVAPSTDDSIEIDSISVIGEEEEEIKDPSENKEKEQENSANTMLANVFKIKGQHRSKHLLLKCPSCDKFFSSSRWTCAACGASLSVASLYYQTSVAVRHFIQTYYASPLVCNEPACGLETRDQFPVDNVHCLQMNCPGKLIRQYSAGQLYDQIASFKETINHLGQSQRQDVSSILAMLNTLTDKSAYNYIDFSTFVMATIDIESAPLLRSNKSNGSTGNKKQRRLGVVALVALVTIGMSCMITASRHPHQDDALESPVDFKGHLVKGSKGAVAVEAEECSHVGVQILKQGGNAVDAAIASTLCIGVIDSFATGIGGGGFMLIRSPNGTFEFIDFRETAPEKATRDMFVENPELAKVGALSIAVPGEIRGLELAHKRHGRLPWSDLFAPAIHIARHGFKATELLAVRVATDSEWMQNATGWSDVYYRDGKPIQQGDLIKRPQLADTLETISTLGADAFYEGDIAKQLVATIQSAGGIVTLEDFKAYRPVIRRTLSTWYNGRKVTTCSEPTSGPVILSVLNLIERFQFKVEGFTGLNLHRLVEAFKFGYAFRTELGDPDYIKNEPRIDEMIQKEYAADIRQKITDDTTHDPLYYNPRFDHVESHGTMHLSVVDENDGAVALTSTVNLIFGSHIMDPSTGVILNDEMDDFSIPGIPNMFGLYPSEYNYAGPRKRPLSSITPTIIEKDARFEMAIGGSGGSIIPTATLNAIVNVLDYGQDLYTAIAAPRVHHQLLPNVAILENGYSKSKQAELATKKHDLFILPKNLSISAVQAVRRLPDGTLEAASDPRKMGIAAAY
ncbi:DNA polymerase alpha catalytic subunit [Mucor ambiguus]|uniref:DNA polymerase alpha catalytic subunit n=1 Tax=Mucor ambiguus TaxID=91626 RepID=A0A0C9M4U8_9FUNG|nr:DNA polymerase alpha catalytic subunit [Mucor ambiguus]